MPIDILGCNSLLRTLCVRRDSNYQVEKYEEVYSEKLETVAAFYSVKFSNLAITTNRSVGLFMGAGFWREIGD